MDLFNIDVEACRGRQKRLLECMQQHRLDLVVVTLTEHVQWLTGPRFGPVFEPAAAMTSQGDVILVAPARRMPDRFAADDVLPYEAQSHSTLRNDQREKSSRVLLDAIFSHHSAQRVGIEFSSCGPHVSNAFSGELVDIEPDLYRLRRRKDPDELIRLQKAIAATGEMYRKAREIIAPGVSELEVFNALQAAAVSELGEMLTGTGNDYRCAARGGPPRDRKAESGELYILDLGPAFRGYFADNARTFAVDRKPTDLQMAAWQKIMDAFQFIEEQACAGKSARELFQEVQSLLDTSTCGEFNHHLGHGIGLFPHEAPHLNPNWDDTLELGDVFAAEPGLYAPELKVGMRLENNYLVTESGVELLSDFPLEL